MKRLFELILGSISVCVEADRAAALLDLLMKRGVDYFALEGEEGLIRLDIPHSQRAALEGAAREVGASYTIVSERGLYYIFRAYKKRVGILVGALLFALILYASESHIWSISVRGNERVGEEAILASLELQGCGVGSYIPSLELERICNAVLLENSELAWMSVNIIGNCAEVVVRERVKLPETQKDGLCDLVAGADGQIERIELYSGSAAVEAGQSVRAGDLLVSGAVSTGKEGVLRYEGARAAVFARTTHTLEVSIGQSYTKKVYSGREASEKSIIFFGKEIKISQKGGKEGWICDTIIKKEQLVLFGKIALPVYSLERVWREYKTESATRTGEEMLESARREGAELIAERFFGAELLSYTATLEQSESECRIIYTVHCIEDIAQKREMDMQGGEKEQNQD